MLKIKNITYWFLLFPLTVALGQLQELSEVPDQWKVPNYFPLERTSFTRLSSAYGYRIHPLQKELKKHHGIDLAAKSGSAVYASAWGKVLESGYRNDYGNYVLLVHNPGVKTLYAHLLISTVEEGELVTKGQIIGAVGNTGMVTGPHLHYEMWVKGKRINPLLYWTKTKIKTSRFKGTTK